LLKEDLKIKYLDSGDIISGVLKKDKLFWGGWAVISNDRKTSYKLIKKNIIKNEAMNKEKRVYAIKKTLIKDGKKQYIFLTDGQSEILETSNKNIAEKLVSVLNENTDNGCKYELITIG